MILRIHLFLRGVEDSAGLITWTGWPGTAIRADRAGSLVPSGSVRGLASKLTVTVVP